jgi:hypothetical protein
MSDPKKPWVLNIEPGSLLLIMALLLLIPLLWVGFFAQ